MKCPFKMVDMLNFVGGYSPGLDLSCSSEVKALSTSAKGDSVFRANFSVKNRLNNCEFGGVLSTKNIQKYYG